MNTSNSQTGIFLFTIAMVVAPLTDISAKLLAQAITPIEVSFARFFLQLPLIIILIIYRKQWVALRQTRGNIAVYAARGFFLGISAVSFFIGISKVELPDALAIFLVAPLILTVLSAIYLKERITLSKLSVIAVGMVGAMIIIRPSFNQFGWYSLMPLVASFSFSLYLLITRFLIAKQSTLIVHGLTNFFAMLTVAILMVIMMMDQHIGPNLISEYMVLDLVMPTIEQFSLMLLMAAAGMVSHLLITAAFRYTQTSILAPLQYLEILTATLFSFIVFSEAPSVVAWLGIALIVLSGMMVIGQDKKAAPPDVIN